MILVSKVKKMVRRIRETIEDLGYETWDKKDNGINFYIRVSDREQEKIFLNDYQRGTRLTEALEFYDLIGRSYQGEFDNPYVRFEVIFSPPEDIVKEVCDYLREQGEIAIIEDWEESSVPDLRKYAKNKKGILRSLQLQVPFRQVKQILLVKPYWLYIDSWREEEDVFFIEMRNIGTSFYFEDNAEWDEHLSDAILKVVG